MKLRGFFLFSLSVLAIVSVAACGGGNGSQPPVALGSPTIASPGPFASPSPGPSPVSIATVAPYTSTLATTVSAPTYVSGQPTPSPLAIAMPTGGGITPTFYLPAALSGGSSVLSATITNTLPAGLPSLSTKHSSVPSRATTGFRRIAASTTATPIAFLGLFWATPITIVSLPNFTFTIPAADVLSGVDYYLAIYDPTRPSLGWQEGWEGPATITGSTLAFAGSNTQYSFAPSVTFWLAVIALPATATQPTPAPSIAPTSVPTQAPPPVSQPASQADAFVGSAGVNTHFSYNGTAYVSDFPAVKALLSASNIRHIRDALLDPTTGQGSTYYGMISQISSSGIGIDLIASEGQSGSQVQGALTAASGSTPYVVDAVEGPNEFDTTANASPSPNPGWASQVSAYQASLYGYVTQTSASTPVVAPAFTTEAAYGSVGNLSAYATYGNARGYFAGRNPGTSGFGAADAFGVYGSIPWQLAMVRQDTGSDPIFVTEAGYNDSSGDTPVPPAVKARYLMRTLLEFWNAGVPRTYIQELVDEASSGEPSQGLITSNGSPKLAYTAVTNFLAQLTDPGASFTTTPLSVGISADSTVHHTLLEKRDGSYRLLLWVEAPSWDPVAMTTLTVAPQPVVLSFGTAPSSLSAVKFNDSGTTGAQTLTTAGSVTDLTVTDDVTIVTIHP